MSYLDLRIKELSDDTEEHLLRSSQPYGWLGLTRAMRHGRLAWVFWVTWIAQVVLFILAVIWGIAAIGATEVLPAVKYGLGAATAMIVAAQVKTSLAPHIHAERILRELKRIEIMVLAQKSGD